MKRLIIIVGLMLAILAVNAQTVGGSSSSKYQYNKSKSSTTTTNRSHRSSKRIVFQPEFTFLVNYAYANAPQHSVGITLGQNKLGKTPLGWYLSLMSGFNFNFGNGGTVGNGGVYNHVAVPFFTGKEQRTRLSGTVGLTVNMVIPLYFYAGVGYGYRSLTWETVGGDWMTYERTSFAGVNADFGFMFNIKGFALSAGYSTINFQYHEVKVGIGLIVKTGKKKSTAAPSNSSSSSGSSSNTENK